MVELFVDIHPFWGWVALACLFLAIEVLIVPSGFFLCMGTSAGIVAVVTFFIPGISWLWAFTLYALIMVVAGFFWWQIIRRKQPADTSLRLNMKADQLVGYRAVLTEDMVGCRGKLRVNDSPWMIEAEVDYPAGTRVEVTAVNGITLVVKEVKAGMTGAIQE